MLERDDHVGLMLPIITCDAAEQVEQLLRGQPDKLAHVAGLPPVEWRGEIRASCG